MEPAFARRDLSSLREEVPAAGPTDDDPAGGRIEVQPALEADRRRRPASEMVFRAEGKPPGVAADGRADGASDEWAGHATVAVVGSRSRKTEAGSRPSVATNGGSRGRRQRQLAGRQGCPPRPPHRLKRKSSPRRRAI